MYKTSKLDLKVVVKVGDKIMLSCPQYPEFDGEIATILEQTKDYTFKVDISEQPFNETMFDGGTLIR